MIVVSRFATDVVSADGMMTSLNHLTKQGNVSIPPSIRSSAIGASVNGHAGPIGHAWPDTLPNGSEPIVATSDVKA